MRGPQLIVDLSTAVLTHALQNNVNKLWKQVSCARELVGTGDSLPKDDPSSLVTDIVGDEVLVIRSDDPVIKDRITSWKQNPADPDAIPQLLNPDVLRHPMSIHSSERPGFIKANQISAPSVLILLGFRFRLVDLKKVDQAGTSENPDTFKALGFGSSLSPYLAFAVSATPDRASRYLISAKLDYAGLFSPFYDREQSVDLLPLDQKESLKALLKTFHPTIDPLTVDLTGALSTFNDPFAPPSTRDVQIVNAAISTTYSEKTAPLLPQHLPPAIRLGIDLQYPEDHYGWMKFSATTLPGETPPGPPIHLEPSHDRDSVVAGSKVTIPEERWSVTVRGDLISALVLRIMEKHVAGAAPIGPILGSGDFAQANPRASWDAGVLEIRIEIKDRRIGGGSLGDVVLRVTPDFAVKLLHNGCAAWRPGEPFPLASTNGVFEIYADPRINACFEPFHLLALKTCASFEFGPTGLLVWFLGETLSVITGSLFGFLPGVAFSMSAVAIGPVGAGAAVGPIVLEELTSERCGPIVGGAEKCRTCYVAVEDRAPRIGRVRLMRVEPLEQTLELGGVIWPEDSGRSAGKLPRIQYEEDPDLNPANLQVGQWTYPSGACKPPDDDPVATIYITNLGEQSLSICQISPRILSGGDVRVLKISTPRPLPADVGPGEVMPVTIQAMVTGVNEYRTDPNDPSPLRVRILSSGGISVFDLNRTGNIATRIDPVTRAWKTGRANLLCELLTTPNPLWKQITFTDPVPFRPIERLYERLDVRTLDPSRGILQAFGLDGQLIGRGYSINGEAQLSVSTERPLAAQHGTMLPLFVLGGAGLHGGAGQGGPTGSLSWATGVKHAMYAGAGALNGLSLASGQAVVAALRGRGSGRAAGLSRVLYQEGPWFPVGSPILEARRFGDALLVLTDGDLRLGQVRRGELTWTRRVPIEGPRRLIIAGENPSVIGQNGIITFGPDLQEIWRRQDRVLAVAALQGHLWVANQHGIAEIRGRSWIGTSIWPAAEGTIDNLVEADGTLLATKGGHAWDLGASPPRRFDIRADRLSNVLGLAAAEVSEGVVLFDRYGRRRAEYSQMPWHGSLLEWPGVALACHPEQGVLAMFYRHETPIDLDHFSALSSSAPLDQVPSAFHPRSVPYGARSP